MLEFPFNIYATAEGATSNLACGWEWPRPAIKPQPEKNVGVALSREAPTYLGFPFNISATAALSS